MGKLQTRHFLIAKTFTKRNRQIAIGVNSYKKSHSVMQHFARLAGEPDKIYLHAEIQCLLRSKDQPIHRLTIERYTNDGAMALARPCKVCMLAIKEYGVKVIEYTSPEGWIKENIE